VDTTRLFLSVPSKLIPATARAHLHEAGGRPKRPQRGVGAHMIGPDAGEVTMAIASPLNLAPPRPSRTPPSASTRPVAAEFVTNAENSSPMTAKRKARSSRAVATFLSVGGRRFLPADPGERKAKKEQEAGGLPGCPLKGDRETRMRLRGRPGRWRFSALLTEEFSRHRGNQEVGLRSSLCR